MDKNLNLTLLIGFFILAAIPYYWGIAKGTIIPNRISWFVWSGVGLVGLVATLSDPTQTRANTYFAWALGLHPICIFLTTYWRNASEKIQKIEVVALAIAVLALVVWGFNWHLAILPLYATLLLVIIADACGAVTTFQWIRDDPMRDRPFAWVMFSASSLFTLLGLTPEEIHINTILLPVWMFIGSVCIACPLIAYRIKHKIPLGKAWIV